MNVSCKLITFYKRTEIPLIFNSSDHTYLMHEFYKKSRYNSRGYFKYTRETLDPDNFIKNYDQNKNNLLKSFLADGKNQ